MQCLCARLPGVDTLLQSLFYALIIEAGNDFDACPRDTDMQG
jgi:hypothetical protein